MPDLTFQITGAEAKPFALVPTLVFRLQIRNSLAHEEVYSAALRCQVMIEAVHREYDVPTQQALVEVFGAPGRWDETLHSLLWTHLTVPLPRFAGSTLLEVPIPCTPDVEVAAGKYFLALRNGVVPLVFLFSGTVFYKGLGDAVQVTQLPWEKEATFRLPIQIWRDLMEQYHPHSTWVRVRQETFDKLCQFRACHALPTLDDCLERLVENQPVLGALVKGGA